MLCPSLDLHGGMVYLQVKDRIIGTFLLTVKSFKIERSYRSDRVNDVYVICSFPGSQG